jgi:tRNA pseudouridine38-40 synthase
MAETIKYRLTIAYVGTNFQGWQRQAELADPDSTTIQSELEAACHKVLTNVKLMASGRTDSGVHARRQVAHLIASSKLEPATLLKALNAHLPIDIRILDLAEADSDFHAQRSAKAKTYRYFLINNKQSGRHINWPFLRGYTWFISQQLDLEKIRSCLAAIEGEHDFKAFQNRGTPVKSTIRRLLSATLIQHNSPTTSDFPWEPPPEMGLSLLEIRLTGTGFLKQMVRNIVGNLVEVGLGKMSVQEFNAILKSCDRSQGGVTAPARGLFLDSVDYQIESL